MNHKQKSILGDSNISRISKMWKIIVLLNFFISFMPAISVNAKSTHLEQLKSRYPYGLIGDDYGLLNEEDLSVNTCRGYATPFSGDQNMAYSYWQCFPIKNAKMECSSLGYDPVDKEETAYMIVEAQNKDGWHSYLARDAMEIHDCKELMHAWKQKTHGEKYVCVSGSYGGSTGIRNGIKETHWVFDKFKTRKGCEAYKNECNLSKHPEKSCLLPKHWKKDS
jgi:hypothetical protein